VELRITATSAWTEAEAASRPTQVALWFGNLLFFGFSSVNAGFLLYGLPSLIAVGTRRSPRPLLAAELNNASGASRREVANVRLMDKSTPHSQPSSPAKAGDPVFRGASDRIEKLRRTGYSAFAEYDGCGDVTFRIVFSCLKIESELCAARWRCAATSKTPGTPRSGFPSPAPRVTKNPGRRRPAPLPASK